MNEIILKATDIKKTFKEGNVITSVLNGINLDIYADEVTAIIGKSGSGKSTLLHILGTLSQADSGSVMFKQKNIEQMNAFERALFRNKNLGFVYQFHHLLGDFSAIENVMMPLMIGHTSSSAAEKIAKEYLEKVGLGDRLDYRPSELSGGERQRVAIARALCNKPDIILADEPTGNLDNQNAQAVFDLFTSLVKEQHAAVVMVTHDRALAERCNRIYEITDGRIDA